MDIWVVYLERGMNFGKINSALDFDGNDMIIIDNFTSLNNARNFSVSMWVNQETLTQGRYAYWQNGNLLINFGSSYGENLGPANVRMRMHLDGNWRTSHVAVNSLDTSGWHYWVFSYDSENATIYKDGVEIYRDNSDASYSSLRNS
jgi:hypothetical protein